MREMKHYVIQSVGAVVAAFSVMGWVTDVSAQSSERNIETVRVRMIVGKDASAKVTNEVTWNVRTDMRGFDFMNPAINVTHMDSAGTVENVENETDRRLAEIRYTERNKWALDIEGEEKLTPGRWKWTFSYMGNLAESGENGLLGRTKDDDGNALLYIHWAPVQWVDPLKSRTVDIVLPVKVSGPQVSDIRYRDIMGCPRKGKPGKCKSTSKIKTSKALEQNNSIDLFGTSIKDDYWLTMRIVQKDVPAQGEQPILFYIDPDYMHVDEDVLSEASSKSDESMFNPFVLLIALVTAGAGIFCISASKNQNKERAATKFDAEMEQFWEAPELQVGSFANNGIAIMDLHPIEVALLLGLRESYVAGMIVKAMGDMRKLEVISTSPICVKDSLDAELDELELLFVNTIDADGRLDTQRLRQFFDTVENELVRKLWNADYNATVEYFLEMMYESPEDRMYVKDFDERDLKSSTKFCKEKYETYDDYYWENRYYFYYYHLFESSKVQIDLGLSSAFNRKFVYDGERKGPIADENIDQRERNGGFGGVGVMVCHSACHDACHDACHSACHHACHSACVSGGSR